MTSIPTSLLDVESAMHRDDGLRGRDDRGVTFQRVGLTREERRVAFDLDQVEPVGGIDHRFEQPGGGYLGMSEAHSMERMNSVYPPMSAIRRRARPDCMLGS